MEIKVHEKSGDYFTVIEIDSGFDTDWAAIHSKYLCGCHCNYLNTDLETYVEVFGATPDCVEELTKHINEVIANN